MARITEEQREKIRSQLILGESQYAIAKDFDVSTATVNKIFKTIKEHEFLGKEVKEEIAIKTKLSTQSESIVKAFDDKVKEQLRRQNLVFNATEKLLVKAAAMIDDNKTTDKINIGDGVQQFEERALNTQDIKNLQSAIDVASITLNVNQRHSNQQINLTNATQNNIEINKEMIKNTLIEFEDEF